MSLKSNELAHPDGVAASVVAFIRELPKYQLHVKIATLAPYVVPYDRDPNETGAFIRLEDLESALARLVLKGELLSTIHPQPQPGLGLPPSVQQLIVKWRDEAKMGFEAQEPDAYDRAQVYEYCADELEKLVAPPPSGGWQLIASAPKEDGWFFAYGPAADSVPHIVCRTAGELLEVGVTDDKRIGVFKCEYSFTHWMPLPAPPAALPPLRDQDDKSTKRRIIRASDRSDAGIDRIYRRVATE